MKFNTDILQKVIDGNYEGEDYEVVEEGEFTQDHKYQSRKIIFKYKDKFYVVYETRSGSPFTDWHYEDLDGDCPEVEKVEVTRYIWKAVKKPKKAKALKYV